MIVLCALNLMAYAFDDQAVEIYFKTTQGRAVLKGAVEAGLTEDEIKYAVVRFFHTADGKKLVDVIVAKSCLKLGGQPSFLDKKTAKLLMCLGLSAGVFLLLEDGWVKKGLFVLIVIKILSIL